MQEEIESTTTTTTTTTTYSLPIVPYIFKLRAAHGITPQHSDHQQYITFCSRRLNKLRSRTDSKHGRGTKFNKQDLEVKIQKPLNEWKFVPKKIDFIEYYLLQSERAWAHGTDLKFKNLEKDDSRVRIHSMRKFKKASKFAQEMQSMAQFVSLDKSTLVEIEAYLYASRAQYELESEQWEAALKSFSAAKKIYSELMNVAIGTDKDPYKNRCEEFDTNIRFCKYNLKMDDGDNLQDLEQSALDNTALISKMNEVLQEKRREMAVAKTQVQIDGKNVAVEQEKMRVLLVKIDNLESQVTEITSGESFESRHLRVFDQLVFAYMEAEKLIQSELQKPQVQSNESSITNLKLLATWVNRKLVAVFVKRNVWSARNVLGEKQTNYVENKNLKPYDLVKILDSTLHRMRDSEAFASSTPYALQYFQTLRVLFLALAYYKRSKEAECQVLNQQGQQMLKKLQGMKNIDSENLCLHLLPKLETIESELRKLNVIVKAQYAQKALGLSSTLDVQSEETVSYNVVQFPPAFESIGCKPTFFDIAGNGIEYPEITISKEPETTAQVSKAATTTTTTTTEEPKKKGWFGLW